LLHMEWLMRSNKARRRTEVQNGHDRLSSSRSPRPPQNIILAASAHKLAVALVTIVLQSVGPSVTLLSPSCYAEPLEYLHHGKKPWT
jgi:hypothetical protein